MKKIIDGKTYNTDTAEFICEWSNNLGMSDFHYFEEKLYRTKKGAWFIKAFGGAMSPAARENEMGTTGGAYIELIKEEKVLEWMEENEIDPDIVEKYFDIEEA